MDKQPDVYNIEVSANATQMLVSHAAFLAKVSPNAANRLIEAFEEAANSLEIMPNCCPWLTDENIPKYKYRYLTFEKRYGLVYRVIDGTVYIDYVLDSRQDNSFITS